PLRRRRAAAGGLEQRCDDAAVASEVAGERLPLRWRLREHEIGARQPPAIQHPVAPVADEKGARIAVGVAGDPKDDFASPAASEEGHLRELPAGATRVIDVRIGTAQGCVEFGPAGMQEAKYGNALVGAIRLEGANTFPGSAVRLAVVRNNHG